jgi:hypothetical protein
MSLVPCRVPPEIESESIFEVEKTDPTRIKEIERTIPALESDLNLIWQKEEILYTARFDVCKDLLHWSPNNAVVCPAHLRQIPVSFWSNGLERGT